MLDCGDLILRYLERLGVAYVFGVPGGSIEPLYNALARSERQGGIRAVTARHETGAAFMADGYARETGRIGVCCATAGPGTTNLLTGVANAYADNIPMLVITAQTSLNRFGQGAFQESSCTGINTLDMFSGCTRYNTLVSHPEQLESKLLHALSHALGQQPGPVHLAIPLDVMRHAVEDASMALGLSAFIPNEVVPDSGSVQRVVSDLTDVMQATIVLGEDAIHSADQWIQLAELRNWNLVTTPRGKGLVNSFHPQYRGVFGFAGHQCATDVLKPENADRVIMIGAALDEVSTAGWSPDGLLSSRLIHLSGNPGHLTRATMAGHVVLGEPRYVVDALLKELVGGQGKARPTVWGTSDGVPEFVEGRFRESCFATSGPVKAPALMTYLSKACPETTRTLFDTGNSFLWGIHHWNVGQPGRPLASRNLFHIGVGFASMGWAIGASVGIAMAARDEPVLCVTGDGSYLMSGQELTTAAQENCNVLMVVLNDSSLGMIRHGQALGGAEQIANELPCVDYAKMAEAIGVESYRIATLEELHELDLASIFARPGPCLLDILVEREEVPPMGVRMKVLKETE
ncbi:thiamine pyrophosphate-binding protein [Marinobacter sediminum]|uniref:thiamine pyrophosphate-binding protein n=1 Tax=Marinobacter sediminum TaxID=256323 RepID=UPI00193A007B|nr:thiamine pyrophosphate-binding protein [Marinobacter sediminum]